MPCHYVISFEQLQGTGRRANRLPFRKLAETFGDRAGSGEIRFETATGGNMFMRFRSAREMTADDQQKLRDLGAEKISGPHHVI